IIAREPHVRGRAAIALSPDGKYAYVTGLAGKAWWPGPAHHVVYRFDLTVPPEMPKGEIAEPFLGEYGVAGSDEKHFKDPSGVSVDAAGNLYVADRGNDRIAVFSPSGKFVRSIPVKAPYQAEVHGRTGDIYVVCSEGKRFRLAKLAKAEDFKQTASIELIAADRTTPIAALDSSAERPAVWYVSGPREIRKLEDIGGAFKDLGEVIAARAGEGYPSMTFQALEVHYSGAKLHLHGPKGFGYLCDATTGEVFWNEDRRVYMRGMDGRLYSYDYLANKGTLIRRYGPDLKPLPFEKSEALSTTRSSPVPYLGYTVDRRGNVYVVTHDYESPHAVIRQYGPDGTLKNPKFFELPLPAMSSWAVATVWTDLDGSFYIACSLKETSATIPPEFRGRLPVETGAKPRARLSYEHLYGAVVKFGPNGGRVIPIGPDEKTPMSVGINYGGIPYCKAEGVEWSRVGISPLAYRNRDHIRCTCEHASFGMDLHGRLYVPDAFRQRVEVLDKNGNLLFTLDSQKQFASAPILAPGRLYVGAVDGSI
ncbi:MAG: hypothetical protein N3A38_16405, partial [Planctomycetota bacterium]|nr:hypothetical protein [Planctomycetota bacterium]